MPFRSVLYALVAAAFAASSVAALGNDAPATERSYDVSVGDHVVHVHEVSAERLRAEKEARPWMRETPYWPLARGFIDGTHVWVDATAWNKRALIAHELGHAMGKGHTWLPTTMNPCGCLRWIDAEDLYSLVPQER